MSYSPQGRDVENAGFRCTRCGAGVAPHTAGSYRNHCPHCLWSRHVDELPGDRAAECGAPMEPVGVDYSGKKGYILLHRCTACGAQDRNKLAPDDDMDRVIELQRPR
ncbi:RNHCP domain-containing protein [Nesterenkonia sp.]|uniref:RNHCP domain-containing protein n=1 Tax=Nesterenkonia sp. TaxID=704201 RepID=UPI0026034EDB|nr:RNHCP domain-containing protein [Nesterenkonia sp.]